MSNEYVFENKNDLVNYLYSKFSNPTQIKVQKTMYLLFAFYGATYGQISKESNKEDFDGQTFPPLLFDANFQAWRYGPVDFDIYRDEKNGVFEANEELIINLDDFESTNVKQFIDDLAAQTDGIDDFSLVDRTHQDNVWIDNFDEGTAYIEINNKDIINEYRERYTSNAV